MLKYTKNMDKFWALEFFTVNQMTGELERVPSEFCVKAVNFQEAFTRLMKMDRPHLRLTGNWFDSLESAQAHLDFEEILSKPSKIVSGMSYDDFMDWLDLAENLEDLEAAIKAFKEEGGLEDYIKIIQLQIKLKYGGEKDSYGGEN